PDYPEFSPLDLVQETWETSTLKEFLSSIQFLFVVFEKDNDTTFFKGAKFWRLPYNDLENEVRKTWEETKNVFKNGVELTYKKYKRPLKSTGKEYYILNNILFQYFSRDFYIFYKLIQLRF